MLVLAVPMRDTRSSTKGIVLEAILREQHEDAMGESGVKTSLFATDNPKADAAAFVNASVSVHNVAASVQMDVWHAMQRIMRHMKHDKHASWYCELEKDCKDVFYTYCYVWNRTSTESIRYPCMHQEHREHHVRVALRTFAFKWQHRLHEKSKVAIEGLLRISAHLVAFAPYRGTLLRYGTTANEWSHLSLKSRFVRANYVRADHFRVWLSIQTLSINMHHKTFALTRLPESHPLRTLLQQVYRNNAIDFASCTSVPWILQQTFPKTYGMPDLERDELLPLF
jgi:hypothetical protein